MNIEVKINYFWGLPDVPVLDGPAYLTCWPFEWLAVR